MRTDAHHHTGEVVKGYARRQREKTAKAETNKKEKTWREKRWHVCLLPLQDCPKRDDHGHMTTNYMDISNVKLADTQALIGKDGEEAVRIWKELSDTPLVPYNGALSSCSHQCDRFEDEKYDSIPEETDDAEPEEREQKYGCIPEEPEESEPDEPEDEDVNNPAIPLLLECQSHPEPPRPKNRRLSERIRRGVKRLSLPDPSVWSTFPAEYMGNEDYSKFLLPVLAEKERALKVPPPTPLRTVSLRITTEEAVADADIPVELPPMDTPYVREVVHSPSRAPREAAVDLLRTREVFIFTDNSEAKVAATKKSRWRKVREFLAAKTPLASMKPVNVVNAAGNYTLSELRSEVDKDVSSFRWFWQSKKKAKLEACRKELYDFGKRYTHFRKGAVYEVLAEDILKDPAFVARAASLLRDGMVSLVTLLQIDKLLNSHPNIAMYLANMDVFFNTRNHLVNQVHLRGLRAEAMKVKVPGATTMVDFRKRARSMEVSPHAPSSKSEPLTPLSTLFTVTTRVLSA